MLLEKVPKEELPRLLDQVTAVLGNRLPQSEDPRRLLRAEALVRTLRGAAELNANPGQLSGWLCAGMFYQALRPGGAVPLHSGWIIRRNYGRDHQRPL